MNVKASSLSVQPPIPQKQLGKYRFRKGVFLIRHEEKVLYIGASTNICKTVLRLFQKQGILSHVDRNKLQFEVIETSFRSPSVESVLKRHFVPPYNKRIKQLICPTAYEKKQCKRILEEYLEQSRFSPDSSRTQAEHKTDLNHLNHLKPQS